MPSSTPFSSSLPCFFYTLPVEMLSVRSKALTLLTLVLLAPDVVHANPEEGTREITTPRWLDTVYRRPRVTGCWERPWVCNPGSFPPLGSRMCCGNRCVDVSNDDNNCGFCGVRCPFSWRCCGGMCVDPSTNPFHCGGCNSRCAFGSLCTYGMCGYAQPLPKLPFPLPCRHLWPRRPLEESPP